MKYRWLYLLISGIVIFSGIFSMFKWGLPIGVEFKGGTLIEYALSKDVDTSKISSAVKLSGVELVSVQKTQNNSYLIKLGQVNGIQRASIQTNIEKLDDKASELRFETIGPTVGRELITKT